MASQQAASAAAPPHASFFQVADPCSEAAHPEPFLLLPQAFAKEFHRYLTQTLVLEAPSGQRYEACLDGDLQKQMRITSGWRSAAQSLNVQSGDLIILDLVCKGHFKVFVYEGEDMCEKNLFKVKTSEPGDKGMQSGIAPESFISGKKRKSQAVDEGDTHSSGSGISLIGDDVNSHRTLGLIETELVESHSTNFSPQNTCHEDLSHRDAIALNRPFKQCATLEDIYEVLQNLHRETRIAFERALSYSSKNPFTIIMMGHSNVCHGFKLKLPRPFVVEHMSDVFEHVALIDSKNKAWSVTWLEHESGFSGGWRYFSMDHHLKCGDICIFEKGRTCVLPAFKVSIFKVEKCDGLSIQNIIPSRISNVIARARRCQDKTAKQCNLPVTQTKQASLHFLS